MEISVFHVSTVHSSNVYFIFTTFVQFHMIHYNTKYGSYDIAEKFPDGRVVVAVFFQVHVRNTDFYEVPFYYRLLS